MTLRPTEVSPATIRGRRPVHQKTPVKKMVIDCKNESQWRAVHTDEVNGVVLRRRPIRAIDTYMNNAGDALCEPVEFKCSQSQLRKKLENHLPLISEEEELRRKFLINDIAAQTRVLITQSRSRDYLFKLCPELPADFQADPNSLKMLVTYRGAEVTFRQPKDKDARSFNPYGVGLFRGQSYSMADPSPVEWKAEVEDGAFYLTIEPFSRRMR